MGLKYTCDWTVFKVAITGCQHLSLTFLLLLLKVHDTVVSHEQAPTAVISLAIRKMSLLLNYLNAFTLVLPDHIKFAIES